MSTQPFKSNEEADAEATIQIAKFVSSGTTMTVVVLKADEYGQKVTPAQAEAVLKAAFWMAAKMGKPVKA